MVLRIAQVHAGGVRLLAGEVQAQDLPLTAILPVAEPAARVLRATVLDPYVLLHVTPRDRQILLVRPLRWARFGL